MCLGEPSVHLGSNISGPLEMVRTICCFGAGLKRFWCAAKDKMLRSKASFGAQQKHKWCAANCLKVKLETGFGKDARKSGISDVFACLSIRRYCLGHGSVMLGAKISDVWGKHQ